MTYTVGEIAKKLNIAPLCFALLRQGGLIALRRTF